MKTCTVPATSRFNIDVKTMVPGLIDSSFGVRSDLTNNAPRDTCRGPAAPAIAVERSTCWKGSGESWSSSTNVLGPPLPVAG